jgi:hypothetical protein
MHFMHQKEIIGKTISCVWLVYEVFPFRKFKTYKQGKVFIKKVQK